MKPIDREPTQEMIEAGRNAAAYAKRISADEIPLIFSAMHDAAPEIQQDTVTTKQYIDASIESANEFNAHHEEMLQEIDKRDARIESLTAAGAEYQRQYFEQAERIAELERELERERMRLASCGVAALGYFDGCKDEYRSASLDDVLRKLAELAAQNQQLRDGLIEARLSLYGTPYQLCCVEQALALPNLASRY